MAEITQNIVLSAIGGDASAAEIGKVNQSFNGVLATHNNIKNAFSERFTHIGLMLFSSQLLQANGLGGEARQILGLLQTSMFAVAGSFGAAAGPILLVVSGLGALIGIVSTAIDKHQQEADALQNTTNANLKSIDAYQQVVDAYEHVIAGGGELTKTQTDLLAAYQAVENDVRSNQLVVYQQEIAAIQKQIQANIDHANAMHVLHSVIAEGQALWQDYVAIEQKVVDTLATFTPGVQMLVQAYEALRGKLQGATADAQLTTQETEALRQKNDQLQLKLAQLKEQFIDLQGTGVQSAQQMAKAFDDMNSKMDADIQQHRDAAIKAENDVADAISASTKVELQYYDNLYAAITKDKEQQVQEHQKQLNEESQAVKKVADQMGSDFGNAFAKMIVEGKSFTDEITAAFKNMAEQIISDIVRMITEWAILTSLGFPVGGAAGGLFGALGFATGGNVMVDQPTLFMAGEAGPETVSVAPVGSPTGGSGGGGSNVSTGDINVNLSLASMGPGDVQQMLSQLAAAIRQETVSAIQFATTTVGVGNRYPNRAY